MRFLNALLLLAALTTLALAWSKEDHELFRVRDELNALEGTDTSFYALLGVPPSAPLAEITKQNKKRSRQLHPDKAIPAMLAKRSAPAPRDPKDKSTGKKPGVTVTKGPSKKDREAVTREATARYQLYSVIVEILKGPQRERYDHFLRNGFPTWRGTGYYFKRYRPGLGTVLGGLLIVFGGAAHYFAMIVGYQRQRKFVEKYVERAKSAAWTTGVPGIPGAGSGVDTPPLIPDEDEGANDAGQMQMNRRQKRWQEKEDRKKKDSPAPRTARAARAVRDRDISRPVDGQAISGPAATKKRVQAENGKTLIVDSVGNVYLEETTEEGEVREFLLDVSSHTCVFYA